MSSYKSTTLIGEDTDLLILLLYHAKVKDCKDIYFRSDISTPYVYNIGVLKQLLSDRVCVDLLFTHAFTGCDTTSRIFGIGKKPCFQRNIKDDSVLRSCSTVICSPKNDKVAVENAGSRAMISLFGGNQSDSLESMRYSLLCKKVATAKTFVTPERLPPTASATKFHSLRTHYQIMVWMGTSEGMDPTEWGWDVHCERLVPIMMDKSPAPDILLQMIHCNCSAGCNTLRCSCRKHGMDFTSACGRCQDSNCDNMSQEPISDEEEQD
ncbi:uncharacterized protein LOC121382658 [Gigantopelta aegis]|uniref:uncharacterized protein LOC121382658 n=1 Tax=Gigantopelta aegis TaxID=1735272 RepID=UPI001B88963E|nr:uncharacterized protein LOC121382658 [Gigantopelta aegis]